MKHLVIATLHVIALWPVTLSQNRILGLNSMSNTHQMEHADALFIVTLERLCANDIYFIKSKPIVLAFHPSRHGSLPLSDWSSFFHLVLGLLLHRYCSQDLLRYETFHNHDRPPTSEKVFDPPPKPHIYILRTRPS